MGFYTYDEFVEEAKNSNLLDKFNSVDLKMAQEDPDFGMSLLVNKAGYARATRPEDKEAYRQEAEKFRASKGYTTDPSGKYAIKLYGDDTDNEVTKIVNRLQDSKFNYNAQEDPLYQQYRSQYLREGQRAAQDTMASAAAMTGGRPSSYAVSAAAQARNNYASMAADKIPELYQQAYNRYMDEFTRQGQIASLKLQQQRNKWNAANSAYAVGDSSLLSRLGVNTNNDPAALQRKYEQAALAYAVGDSSKYNELGISTANDLNRQYLLQQINAQQKANEMLDANYNLSIAQIIAQLTGDTSMLNRMYRTGSGGGGSNGNYNVFGVSPDDPAFPYAASMYYYNG